MHLRHLFLLAALSLAAALPAKEDPKAVLDAAVSKLENSGGVRGQFTITQFEGTKEAGTTHGHLTMKGEKYTLTTPEHITWYDGQTQWTWLKSSNEVNVTSPTQTELRKSSPAALLGAYKKGYKLSMKRSKLRHVSHCGAARKLSAALPANSVGYHVEVPVGKHEHRIFVVLPGDSFVGLKTYADHRFSL